MDIVFLAMIVEWLVNALSLGYEKLATKKLPKDAKPVFALLLATAFVLLTQAQIEVTQSPKANILFTILVVASGTRTLHELYAIARRNPKS